MTQTSPTPRSMEELFHPQHIDRRLHTQVADLAGVKFRPLPALEVTISEPLEHGAEWPNLQNYCFQLYYVEYVTGKRKQLYGTVGWTGEPDLTIDYTTYRSRMLSHLEQHLNRAGYTLWETDGYRAVQEINDECARLSILLNNRPFEVVDGNAIYKERVDSIIYGQNGGGPGEVAYFMVRQNMLKDIPGLIDNVLCLDARHNGKGYDFEVPQYGRTQAVVMYVSAGGKPVASSEFYKIATDAFTIDRDGYLTAMVPVDLAEVQENHGQYQMDQSNPWVTVSIVEDGVHMRWVKIAALKRVLDLIREKGVNAFAPQHELPPPDKIEMTEVADHVTGDIGELEQPGPPKKRGFFQRIFRIHHQ